MTTVNMLKAKTSLSKLVEVVESGAEADIIIARNGKPAAKLVPIDSIPKKSVKQRVGMFEGQIPPFTLEEFNSTDAEIAKLFGVDES